MSNLAISWLQNLGYNHMNDSNCEVFPYFHCPKIVGGTLGFSFKPNSFSWMKFCHYMSNLAISWLPNRGFNHMHESNCWGLPYFQNSHLNIQNCPYCFGGRPQGKCKKLSELYLLFFRVLRHDTWQGPRNSTNFRSTGQRTAVFPAVFRRPFGVWHAHSIIMAC